MRKGVLSAALLAAVVALSAAPAQAVPLSAPAALKSAGEAIDLTANVCWGECGYGYEGPRYYRPYYRPYRPHYGPYYRPRYYGYYDRPYYRPYYRPYGYGYGYRPVPWWVSGPYYSPRPRYYIGPNVYWY